MTSKESLKKINQYWADMNVLGESDIVLNNTDWESVYKDLEILEIIKKYLVRIFDYPEGGNYFCLELHKFIYEKEGMKFKEWLENE